MEEKWCKLPIKQKIAIISAIAAFILGWALTVYGFILPPVGEIADSVLWVLGQSLIYSSSVFGITQYFTSETNRMKRDIKDYINDEERRRDEIKIN